MNTDTHLNKKIPHEQDALINAFNDLITKKDIPNFLFVGDSLLHMLSFNAFCEKMSEDGISLSGVVCNCVLESRKPQFCFDDIDTEYIDGIVYLQNGENYKSNRSLGERLLLNREIQRNFRNSFAANSTKEFYFIHPAGDGDTGFRYLQYAFAQSVNVIEVIIEEGVGSYSQQTWQYAFTNRLAQEDNTIKRLTIYAKHLVLNNQFQKIRKFTSNKLKVTKFQLFAKVDKGYTVINSSFRSYFYRALSRNAYKHSVPSLDFANTVIITTTNFSQWGQDSLEKDLLCDIIKAIEKAGYIVYLRPHPRTIDTSLYKNLGVEVDIYSKISIESLIAKAIKKPVAIVGFCSSSEVIISAMWDIPCFSLTPQLRDEYKKRESDNGLKLFLISCEEVDDMFADRLMPLDNLDMLHSLIESKKETK